MISKNIVIAAIAIIVGFAAIWLAFKSTPQLTEPFGVVPSTQNPYVEEYSLPPGAAPNGIVVDKQGLVWVVSSAYDILYSFDPGSDQLKDYEIKSNSSSYQTPDKNSTMVWTILQDNDGLIWFSPLGASSIWRFGPIHETFDKFQSETGSAFQMKVDNSTGDIWFTTLSGNTLSVIEKDSKVPSGYKMVSFNLGNDTAPAGLYLKNNSVWVTEITTQQIIQYEIHQIRGLVGNITKVAEFPPNNKTLLSSPTDVIVNNNTMWLTEHGTSFLTEYDLGSNEITRYPTSQNVFHATTLPFWIRAINNGKDLWFNEHEGNKLAYFDTVNKTMIEYNIPSRPKDGFLTYPLNIATDPRDNMVLWFSEWNTDKIGKIDGHLQIPFSISTKTSKIILSNDASKETVVNLDVNGQSPYNKNSVFINASSSVTPDAGFGSVDARISPDSLDLSSEHKVQLSLRNYSTPPGNYTLAISVSDGFVVKTIFLELVVPRG